VWLVRSQDDLFWQTWHLQKKHCSGIETTKDWTQLFAMHRDLIRGAVLFDDQLYRGDLLAVNVAACEDLIVATPEIAKRLQLPVKIDLRGRFKTYAEGLQWLWEHYRTAFNPHLCDFRFPGLLSHATFDYSYQWRAIMFWPAGPKEADKPGVDRATEFRLVARILSEMPIGGVCLGFPAMNEGEGLGEPPGVELLSRYGKSLVCNNHGSNFSILSGMRIDRLTPPPPLPVLELEKDKIYIALVMSDGDNQILWPAFFRRYFEHANYGKFPLAFGMGPAIRELQPGIAQWYYEHATPNTEFITDVSGAGYMHPDSFGAGYQQPKRVWADFLTRTKRLMLPLDHRSIRTVGGNDDNLARYAEALPFCHSIFADMGRYSGRSGIEQLTYTHASDMPIFRSVTSWQYGKEGFLREITEQVGKQRPAFVNGFVHCWTFDMEALSRIYEERASDMVFVTPSQLAQLYRAAASRDQGTHP
jgi:hypothetical protein